MAIRGDAKIVTQGDEVRKKLLKGMKTAYDAVAAGYGPVSGNVAIQRNYGKTLITHDGVSIIREIFSADEIEDTGIGLLSEASEVTNSESGDATSATVLLGSHIAHLADQRIVAGYNPMLLRRGIDKAARYIEGQLDSLSTEIKDKDLYKVAAISGGDEELGKQVELRSR